MFEGVFVLCVLSFDLLVCMLVVDVLEVVWELVMVVICGFGFEV